MVLETTTIDRLFFELSQFATVRTLTEIRLVAENDRLRTLIQGVIHRCEPSGIVGDDPHFFYELAAVFE